MPDPLISEALRREAETLIDLKQYLAASTLLERTIAGEPENYELLCLLARAQLLNRKPGRALKFVEKAINLATDRDHAHRLRSMILRDLTRFPESLTAAQEAVRLDQKNAGNWQVLANACLHIADRRGARDAANKMLELEPDSFLSHQTLAFVAISEGNFEEVINHCRRELELNPNSFEGMNSLGVAYLRLGRRDESVAAFHASFKLDPVQAIARRNLVRMIGISPLSIRQWLGLTLLLGAFAAAMSGAAGYIWVGVTLFAAYILVAAAVIIVRSYRFHALQGEVRKFYRLARKSERSVARRKSLRAVSILSSVLFLLWLFVIWLNWDRLAEPGIYWFTIVPAALFGFVAALALIGYWRARDQTVINVE